MERNDKLNQTAEKSESNSLNVQTLQRVVSTLLAVPVTEVTYETQALHGGTLGQVSLISGKAITIAGQTLPYKVVLKVQKKWERYGDANSWRREYDLYASDLATTFSTSLRWPTCYHTELSEDKTHIYMEAIEGISGLNLTGDMYERAAYELGKFQGKCYAENPSVLHNLTNLSRRDYMKQYYLHYRSWPEVYDFIRSEDCDLPKHLCEMLIIADEQSEETFQRIEKLPIVFCHRDFWVTNIFYQEGKIVLIDWDTTGWGYLGEDIASLIADEADVEHMVEYYHRCVPAYYRGFSEYALSHALEDHCVRQMILFMFGYHMVEWFKFARTPERKTLAMNILQKFYEME